MAKREDSLKIAKQLHDILDDNKLTPANRKNLKKLTSLMRDVIHPNIPGFKMSVEVTEEIQCQHIFKGNLNAITFEFIGQKFSLRYYIININFMLSILSIL